MFPTLAASSDFLKGPLVEISVCTWCHLLDGPIFLKGPLVEISVCTWRPVLDAPTFSQGSLSRNFCVHLVSSTGWAVFSQGSLSRNFYVRLVSCVGWSNLFSKVHESKFLCAPGVLCLMALLFLKCPSMVFFVCTGRPLR